MPRASKLPHPAFALMLAESKSTGLPKNFTRDLTVHDHAWIEARDPKLPFLWCLRDDGTHTVALEPRAGRETGPNSAPQIFESLARGWPGASFYIWDGVALHGISAGSNPIENARQALAIFLEGERERAAELAAKFCQSNPATPHEWRGAKCTFCDAPKHRE